MFSNFANVRTMVALSRDLRRGKTPGPRIAGGRVVLLRDAGSELPPAGEEVSVRTDAPTLAFRRLYRKRLLGGGAEPPGGRRQETQAD
ncbi:hypothetical protein F7D14_06005 [Methylocystis parvus]|uniref:Uncharacterized protein n=1 Tax=Methylocystis parvus TaxID=134 RepID=A0A6B8M8M8_9HYPH|nr:hypothetical protein F7D14_06005 [Methylocystis parvus]